VGFESEVESLTPGQLGPSTRQCPCSSAHSIDTKALPGTLQCTDEPSHVTSVSALFIFPIVNTNYEAQTFQDVEDIVKKDNHRINIFSDTFKDCFVQLLRGT
jgi:hypothetical protein